MKLTKDQKRIKELEAAYNSKVAELGKMFAEKYEREHQLSLAKDCLGIIKTLANKL